MTGFGLVSFYKTVFQALTPMLNEAFIFSIFTFLSFNKDIVLALTLFSLLLLVSIINVSYWIWITSSFPRQKVNQSNETKTSNVSIVICSKNDHLKLRELLDHLNRNILSINDEIIVVNDYSSDDTAYQTLAKEYPITLVTPNQNIIGKKSALLTGLQAASHEKILITDVDCMPRLGWKKEMLSVSDHVDLVLGYSPYRPQKSSINNWIRFESFITGIQYLSYASQRKAYMGVGRNMLIRKSAVESITLNDLHSHIPSGDDDMLAQLVDRVNVCLAPSSFVDSDPKRGWKTYFLQKVRHYGISTEYPNSIKILLSWFSISQIAVLLFALASLSLEPTAYIGLILLVRWLIIMICSKSVMKTLETSDLWLLFPLYDIVLSIYYIIFGFSFLLPKSKLW